MGEIADALRQADRLGSSGEGARNQVSTSEPPPRSASGEAAATQEISQPEILDTVPHLVTRLLDHEEEAALEPGRVILRDPLSLATHQYRRLALRINELTEARQYRSIVVTSAQPDEGKTTTACNLAVQLSQLDQAAKIVLVDLDLHRASIGRYLNVDANVSASEVLRGEHTIEEALIETDLAGLSLLLEREPTKQDSAWLLAHSSLKSVIGQLEVRFDFVIIDTPPILATSDAQMILRHASSALLVARAGATRSAGIKAAADLIPTEKRLGTMLNFSPTRIGLRDPSYYGYGKPSAAEATASRFDGHGEDRNDGE